MADVTAQGHKEIAGVPTSIGSQMFIVHYDFSADGGATADKVLLLTADKECSIRLVRCSVQEGFTSGGAATVSLGVDSGTEFFDGKAITELALGDVVMGDAPASLFKLPADSSIELGVGVAALTAGKASFLFEVFAA